jgi:hypothetical protein
MRVFLKRGSLAAAVVVGAFVPAFAQSTIGSIGCAAILPMIGMVILGCEMTLNEAYWSTLGCVLGPVGWLLADALVQILRRRRCGGASSDRLRGFRASATRSEPALLIPLL